jgi:Tol biopolymer transport system component
MTRITTFLAIIAIAILSATTIAYVPQGGGERLAQGRSGGGPLARRQPRIPRKYADGELLVKFRRGTTKANREVAHGWARGARTLRTFRAVADLDLVRLPDGVGVDEALALYEQFPDVEYVEPNYTVEPTAVPNDPQFGSLWGLHNDGQSNGALDADIDAPEAWDVTTGSTQVVVAVIDTGVDYRHEDLAANMFRNTADCNANGVDDDGNGYVDDCYGIDTADGDSDPMDDWGHGTHTAGTIGAVGHNGIGVAGVSQRVKLIACRFMSIAAGGGSISDAIECLDYVKALKDRGVNVVATSNSWGWLGGPSQALYDAINMQRQRGILFVAAAGNNGLDADASTFYPASYYLPNVISVAATTRTDSLAGFSNYGRQTVHLGAPGQEILSTMPGNTYSYLSGTSMATPHVSGVAALLKAQDSSRDWRAIRNLILTSGDVVSGAANTVTGRRLNANKALRCSGSEVLSRLRPIGPTAIAAVGSQLTIAMLHAKCGVPAGDVSVTIDPYVGPVTLLDNGDGGDQVAGDGIYTAQWSPPVAGTFVLGFPNGDLVSVTTTWPQYEVSSTAYAYRAIGGTNLNLTDDSTATVATPFPIRFGPLSFTTMYVCSNGAISFSSPFCPYVNGRIPRGDASTLVAPFWDDFWLSPSQNVFWAVRGSAPDRELVVEWRNVEVWGCPGSPMRFQAVFFERRSDILFNFRDTLSGTSCGAFADRGGSATVGIQVAMGVGTELSYNSPALADGTAYLWKLNQGVLEVTPNEQEFGNVQVGASVDRPFRIFNAGGAELTGIVTAPPPFEIVAGASFSLAAGAYQDTIVRFAPAAAGNSGATLRITSNVGADFKRVSGTGVIPLPPVIRDVLPWFGTPNTRFDVEVLGANLDRAVDVKFLDGRLSGRLTQGGASTRRIVDLYVAANAAPGTSGFALVAADGTLSNFVDFEVRSRIPPRGYPVMNGKIAFQSSRDGQSEIYVMNPDGTAPINLTQHGADDADPAWCSDGTKLVFSSTREGRRRLYVMNAYGTDVRRLTALMAADDGQPAWSPDCTRILFTRTFGAPAGDLYMINADGSGERRITYNAPAMALFSAPVWSPDGTKFAFMLAFSDTATQIVIANVDGSGQRQLTEGASSRSPQFSPNGQQIVFDRGPAGSAEIWVMNADGSNQRQLTFNGGLDERPAWSADGAQIVFTSSRTGTAQVYVMDADGSNQRRLTTTSTRETNADWQTTGQIVFAKAVSGIAQIHVMNADGSRQRQLTDVGSNQTPAWSPDRMKIAFDSSRNGSGDIYVMNADGSDQVNITNDPGQDYQPAWSPDGRCLLFTSTRSGDRDVWKACGPNWSQLSQLTFTPGDDGQATWSPNGQRIAFVSSRTGRQGLYLMNPDGSGAVLLSGGQWDERAPAWSPNSQWIAFGSTRDGNVNVYRVHAAGLHLQRLTADPGLDDEPTWSPDGSEIAFVSTRAGDFNIFVMRWDGSNPVKRTISPSDYLLDWGTFAKGEAPGPFGKTYPYNAQTGVVIRHPHYPGVALMWGASNDASGYEYCIDTVNNNLCDTSWREPDGERLAVQMDLVPGVTYFWQVRARYGPATTPADGGAWWSFTTNGDVIRPQVLRITPPSGATGVSRTTTVSIVFSEWVDDFALQGIELKGPGDVDVPFTVRWDGPTYTLTLIPQAPLAGLTTYTVWIWGGIWDAAGNQIGDDIYSSFTTAGAASTIGVTTIGPLLDSGDRNNLNGSKVRTTAAGQAMSMTVYVGAVDAVVANTQYQLGIYTDNGGRPGTLVAVASPGTLAPNAWNTLSITAPLAANTNYWLMFNTNGRSVSVNNMRYAAGVPGQGAYSTSGVPFGTWPTTFPAATLTNNAFSLYATVGQ